MQSLLSIFAIALVGLLLAALWRKKHGIMVIAAIAALLGGAGVGYDQGFRDAAMQAARINVGSSTDAVAAAAASVALNSIDLPIWVGMLSIVFLCAGLLTFGLLLAEALAGSRPPSVPNASDAGQPEHEEVGGQASRSSSIQSRE